MHTMRQHDKDAAYRKLEELESRKLDVSDIPALIQLLSQPYQWFRIRAAELLGSVNGEEAVRWLAIALNDRCEYVSKAAAASLSSLQGPEALDMLRRAFAHDEIERPHYLANAIAKFGDAGFALLEEFARSESATLRYFAARGLGSTGNATAQPVLESMRADTEKTRFGGQVSTSAKEALRTLRRIQANASAVSD